MNKTRFHRLHIVFAGLSLFSCFSCASSMEGLSIEEAKDVVSSFEAVTYEKYSYQAEINCLGLGSEESSKDGELFVDSKKTDTVSKDKDGNDLSGTSACMHTLSSEHGWTRICHYGYNDWTPAVSLFKVYVRCHLWLEMYEAHLQTGNPIDYYLKHA